MGAKLENHMEEKETKGKAQISHTLKTILIIIAVVFALGLVFALGRISAGRSLGVRQNVGSLRNNNFNGRQMMGRSGGYSQGLVPKFKITGSVIQITGSNITVKGTSKDYSVITSANTSVIKSGAIAKLADLKVGDNVTVSGPSNSDGAVNATVINIQ